MATFMGAWRRSHVDGPPSLRLRITPHGGKPSDHRATRAPAQDRANGVRVYVCELPGALFRSLPHSSVDFEHLPGGMVEITFMERAK
jgi:hypothetical protein